jgi:hypothetical protein
MGLGSGIRDPGSGKTYSGFQIRIRGGGGDTRAQPRIQRNGTGKNIYLSQAKIILKGN